MRPTARAWAVWIVGVAAYLVAVVQRTSLGVAGLDAAERFDVGASTLAAFVVLQLLVYAALQIPVGLLLDRFGSVRLVVCGALLMASGQALLAVAHDVSVGVAGRVLVGAGDAMTFISVLRLVPGWFPARQAPVLTQLTGILGQLGQVLSAVPFVALLGGPGWVTAFLSAAATSVLMAVIAVAVLRDTPERRMHTGPPASLRRMGAELAEVWRHPGTRLGLWTHFTTPFPGNVFALMWGFPFLVAGEGLPRTIASALLTLFVLTGTAVAPLFGLFTRRQPLRRSWLVLGVVLVTMLSWSMVIFWPGPAPLPLLALLMLVLGLGGPGSMIAFDFARTFNPPDRLGTASGIVNVGGFISSLATILLIGVVLDVRTGGVARYEVADFRYAMSVQFVAWGIGVAGILRTRHLARRRLAEEGVVAPRMRDLLPRRRRPGG